MSAVVAQTAAGCAGDAVRGAGCEQEAKTAAVLSTGGATYQSLVGYAANAGPGENRNGTKLDGASNGKTSNKQTRKALAMKTFFFLFAAITLTACVTLKGNYEIKAFDADSRPLDTGMVLTAAGSGIYTVRNALCQRYPKAKIIIVDMQTRQELASESPYQCR